MTVPYKSNRAVLFDSALFHETDRFTFQKGYQNRRINLTILYGEMQKDLGAISEGSKGELWKQSVPCVLLGLGWRYFRYSRSNYDSRTSGKFSTESFPNGAWNRATFAQAFSFPSDVSQLAAIIVKNQKLVSGWITSTKFSVSSRRVDLKAVSFGLATLLFLHLFVTESSTERTVQLTEAEARSPSTSLGDENNIVVYHSFFFWSSYS